MKFTSTTKDTPMHRSSLALLLSITFAAAALTGCSKQAPTDTAHDQAAAAPHTIPADEQAARYVDPKVGLKTTPFSVAAPAEHPAKAHTAAPAH